MSMYCVNKNTDNNGYHEVHKGTCSYRPDAVNRKEFQANSDADAMRIAGKSYSPVDGCAYCMSGYHNH